MKEKENQKLDLQFSIYTFKLIAIQDINLSEFNASAWRGIFGHSLKKVACTTDAKSCDGCLLKSQCAYGYVFESSPNSDSDRMRKYNAIPHPYVIKNSTQTQIAEKQMFDLTFILFGKANEYLPYILQAFIMAGKKGITQKRSQFSVEYLKKKTQQGFDVIWHKNNNELKSTMENNKNIAQKLDQKKTNTIQIAFKTPLKIMRDGRQVTAENFQLSDLIKSLTRRISMLSYFHTSQKLELDYTEIHRSAEMIGWEQQSIKQAHWKRYSNRQKKAMNIRGIVGEVTFTLSAEQESLWQLLCLGSNIHAGKLTTMGLGEYNVKKW